MELEGHGENQNFFFGMLVKSHLTNDVTCVICLKADKNVIHFFRDYDLDLLVILPSI